MCYNFGIETYGLKKFEDSVFWLRLTYVWIQLSVESERQVEVCEHVSQRDFFFFSQSYDIGKMNIKYAPGPEVQVKQCGT